MKFKISSNILAVLILSSCINEVTISTNHYTDIPSIIHQSIDLVKKNHSKLKKESVLNQEKTSTTIENPDWENEWDMFESINLNKPAFQNLFLIDSTINQLVYTAKAGEDLPIKKVIIEKDSLGKIVRLTIDLENTNSLFETSKHLEMTFSTEGIKDYSIQGYQKIRWMSPTQYQVRGEILQP